MKKRMTALVLMLALCLSLSACGGETPSGDGGKTYELSARSRDLMEGVTSNDVPAETLDLAIPGVREFGVELFRRSVTEGENTLVSPLSVLTALAMTANGSGGNTRAQMEEVLGLSVDDLNLYLHWLMAGLSEEGSPLHLANAIWFKDDENLTVEQTFLQANADYYGAGAFQAPFDDTTLRDINGWVEENTGGEIEELLSELPGESVICLVNALSFNGRWETAYKESQVREGVFTTEAGEERKVTYLQSTEYRYLEDELATGFAKDYEGGRFAFVALLPDEGVSVADYLASLTGEKVTGLISSAQRTEVRASIPKFETEYRTELPEVLAAMGMTDAFSAETADFSAMGNYAGENLYISDAVHQCTITVDETGSKAGASTAVLLTPSSAPSPEEVLELCLDRPFVYFIVDCASGLPIFAGTMMDPAA